MSTAIAFLSGKGGSGKTTLALSMADLLCRCGVKTLLIDCDMSTNGATYFYESQAANERKDKKFQLFSFNNLIYYDDFASEKNILKIEQNLGFVPSIPEISGEYLNKEKKYDDYNLKTRLTEFLDWARLGYDVILFDCQAGYTNILPVLLPLMDVDLFVLEADSISGSAMRSLHLKIGNFLGNARLYQIFNKATAEEFDIYSKIVGTFFVNIGTLLFDWKIRQAFSRSQIPDIENTSAKFGSDLCNICKIILPSKDIQQRLAIFLNKLHYQHFVDERKKIEKQLSSLLRPNLFRIKLKYSASLIVLLGMIAFFFVRMNKYFSLDLSSNIIMTLSIFLCLLIFIFPLTADAADTLRGSRNERQKYERRLKEIDKELKKIDNLVESNMNK